MQKIKRMEKIHKNYASLLTGIKKHNILNSETSLQEILNNQEGFWDEIIESLSNVREEIEFLKSLYDDEHEYSNLIHGKLLEKDVPVILSGKNLLIGPMIISFNLADFYVQITIGRKRQRITELEPNIVVKKLEQVYRKLNSSFNATLFFRRLLKAYDFINTKMYSSRQTKYGYSVALKDIYELFSLSPSSTDYKIENFLWDIGRLLAVADSFNGYRIELGFSRDVKKMYLIKTASGEEVRASTLTVYERSDDERLE